MCSDRLTPYVTGTHSRSGSVLHAAPQHDVTSDVIRDWFALGQHHDGGRRLDAAREVGSDVLCNLGRDGPTRRGWHGVHSPIKVEGAGAGTRRVPVFSGAASTAFLAQRPRSARRGELEHNRRVVSRAPSIHWLVPAGATFDVHTVTLFLTSAAHHDSAELATARRLAAKTGRQLEEPLDLAQNDAHIVRRAALASAS